MDVEAVEKCWGDLEQRRIWNVTQDKCSREMKIGVHFTDWEKESFYIFAGVNG